MPKRKSPLTGWVKLEELPGQAPTRRTSETKDLLTAFAESDEKYMGKKLEDAELKRQLNNLRATLKRYPELAEKVSVGKRGDMLVLMRKDLD